MIFYIILFLSCINMFLFNNVLKTKYSKRIFEITTIVILCLISGTRYYLGGTDYKIYKNMYDAIPNVYNFNFNTIHKDIYEAFGVEKGYLFLNSIVKTIGLNFYGFTLIHSIIFYTCMYIGLKKYNKNFNFLIIVFLYKMFFYDTFISMRQSLTIAIFFIAIKYIQERKIIKYTICCLIAGFLHNGALILFPIYFINKLKLNKRKIIILNFIFIPTILLSILNIKILGPFDYLTKIFTNPVSAQKAQELITTGYGSEINLFHTIEYFTIMFLVIKKYESLNKVDENAEFIIKLFILLLPIFTIFRGYEILTREKDYFILTYATILGYLYRIENSRYSAIVKIATISICFFGFIRFIILFDNGAMIPYESYLFNNCSIFY